ncbi:MAG: hypothetical protein BWY06_01105 [Candidatus Latescibacteria bacterium ADurb.Bin168]|nr:MAG: hypothetical protein BWY06_01105 [Candidatus Latescibacteria bacterium ADurb.Bin168]
MTKWRWSAVTIAIASFCGAMTIPAADSGYFLTARQKGQLVWRGQIQDSESTWYDIWIVPGYVESLRGARQGFEEAGRSLREYVEPQKYRDIRRQSRQCFDAAWDDCIVDFTIEGTPRAWRNYLGKAQDRVNQRVFGWWMAYPWALMQGTVENVVRVPVGLSAAAIAVGAGVAGVPAYHATNSGFKAAWIATFDGLLWPANVCAWTTVIAPPLAFLGQKPAPSRVDGFWVRMVEDTTGPNASALAALVAWGAMLEREVGPLEEQREGLARETESQLSALRDEMRRVNQQDSTAKAAISHAERARVDSTRALPRVAALLDSLARENWSENRLNRNRETIKAALVERGLTEEQATRTIRLLERYPPPSRQTRRAPTDLEKTDPVRESVNVIETLE